MTIKIKNVNQYFIIRHNILFLRFEYKRNLKLIKIFYSFLRAKSIDVKKHSRISEDYSFNMRAPTFIHVDIRATNYVGISRNIGKVVKCHENITETFQLEKNQLAQQGQKNSLQPLITCKHFFIYRLLKIISKERNKKFHYVHYTSIVTTNQMFKIQNFFLFLAC